MRCEETKGRIAIISVHACPFVVAGAFNSGGLNTYLRKVCFLLACAGYEVDIFTRTHKPQDSEISSPCEGVKIYHLDIPDVPKDNLFPYLPHFFELMVEQCAKLNKKYDLIYSHYWLSTVISEQLKYIWKVPVVSTFHTLAKLKWQHLQNYSVIEHPQRIRYEKQAIEKSEYIVALSEQEKSDLIEHFSIPDTKIQVISPGVDLNLFKPQQQKTVLDDSSGRKFKLLYVGRIDESKGINYLFEAVGQLDKPAEFELSVVGGSNSPEELRYFKELICKFEVRVKTNLFPAVSQTELIKYYQSNDLLLIPSIYESFGLVALEGMACSLPIVAFSVGNLSQLVQNEVNGLLVPFANTASFAQCIVRLHDEVVLYQKMISNTRKIARQFKWSNSVEKLNKLFSLLIFHNKGTTAYTTTSKVS